MGHEPEPFTLVRGTNGGCGEQTPFRIEPELGKVTEDVREPVLDDSGDVLQEHPSRSHFADDAGDFRPEPTVVVNSTSFACSAERLAGEPGSDDIHAATPRVAVEGGKVRPDRSLIQPRLAHPFHEDGRCVAVPLNVSHGSAVHAGESQSELEASVAGAEVEGT